MTALLDVIDLDRPAAHVAHGNRLLAWSLTDPGQIHRNRYARAWVQVIERQPMRGEPLTLWMARRPAVDRGREPFTDACVDACRREVLPRLARDFGDRWEAAHRAAAAGDWRTAADDAIRIAAWYARAADLADLYATGHATLRPPAPDDGDRSAFIGPPQVSIRSPRGGTELVTRVADVWADGEHVGWLTERGIAPLDGWT